MKNENKGKSKTKSKIKSKKVSTKSQSKKAAIKDKSKKSLNSKGRPAKPKKAKITAAAGKPNLRKLPAIGNVVKASVKVQNPSPVESVPQPSISSLAPAASPTPVIQNRPPMRKVVGGYSVPVKTFKDSSKAESPAVAPAPPKVSEKNNFDRIISETKYGWSKLPKFIPAQTRFLIGMAEKECENGAKWPFQFAKFISSLPAQLCGVEFAVLILDLEHPAEKIAALCSRDAAFIEDILLRARNNFHDLFAAGCSEMYRKLKTQLAGLGVDLEVLTEQYLVSQVNREFQVTLGAIILKTLRAQNDRVPPLSIAV